MTRRELLIGSATFALVPLAGGATALAARRTHRIDMQNMRFGAVPANIRAGDAIEWINRDIVPHTATARDRSFDVVIAPRRTATMIAPHAGTIAFYCRYHPAMRGSLVVAR